MLNIKITKPLAATAAAATTTNAVAPSIITTNTTNTYTTISRANIKAVGTFLKPIEQKLSTFGTLSKKLPTTTTFNVYNNNNNNNNNNNSRSQNSVRKNAAINSNKVQRPRPKQQTPIFVTKTTTTPTATTTATKLLIQHKANISLNTSLDTTQPNEITNKMEHSYTRDGTRADSNSTGLAPTRTILVRRPPQCPSCHTHPLDEHELNESNHVNVPSYDEISAKEAMNECARIAKYVKNQNPDDEVWDTRINQIGWSNLQKSLFNKVVIILDYDHLGRLANDGRAHEAMQRRALIDKSTARMRRALASISWDQRITQWLHCLLMDNLPSSYMASYLDILQTLKNKLPSLMDKMLFARPLNVSQELLAPVMKKQWEPTMITKSRHLTQSAIIIALPTMPTSGTVSNRMQKWYQYLASITQIVQITLPNSNDRISRQSLDVVAETIVSLTRVKIHELRNENPSRGIILVGFNAGASMVLQVAMSESVACVVCMGFAYNTLNGVRGTPDDRLLDIKAPILFVIGQNSARTSQEEMESLREKMQSETSLVVVGSADDMLRLPKSRQKIENITQSMVDSMVADEVYDFINKTLSNPPGPRMPNIANTSVYNRKTNMTDSGLPGKLLPPQRKRKQDGNDADQAAAKTKYVPHIGRPRTRPLPVLNQNMAIGMKTQMVNISATTASKVNDDLNHAMQSILGDGDDTASTNGNGGCGGSGVIINEKLMSNFEIVPQSKATAGTIKATVLNPLQKSTIITGGSAGGGGGGGSNATTISGTKIKMISNQFVQIKPQMQSQSKIYTIKTTTQPQQKLSGAASTSIGSIIKNIPTTSTSGQQQIFTLKSPNGQTTQFVTAAPPAAQQKYTVVKNANGGTTLQLTKNVAAAAAATAGAAGGSGANSNLDLSNIIDMPIIFADNDGNLSEAQQQGNEAIKQQLSGTITGNIKPMTASGVGKLIISQKILKEGAGGSGTSTTATSTQGNIVTTNASGLLNKSGTFVFNKPTITAAGGTIIPQAQLGSGSKVVYLNRNTMKPCTSTFISRQPTTPSTQMPQYTKIVVTNPKTAATTLVSRPNIVGQLNTAGAGGSGGSGAGSGGSSGTPIVSGVKQLNLQTVKSTLAPSNAGTNLITTSGGLRQLSVTPKTLSQFQIINAGNATTTVGAAAGSGGGGGENKPQQIRNIVLKAGGLKQIPPHLTSQLLNRNISVRKLVNIVPGTAKAGTLSFGGTTNASGAGGVTITATPGPLPPNRATAVVGGGTMADLPSTSSSTAIQSSPKIITLNPINTSALNILSSQQTKSTD